MQFMSCPPHEFTFGGSYGVDKKEWIDEIIDCVRDMEYGDEFLVYDYGKDGNLKLIIVMDDDMDIKILVDLWNNADDMVYPVDETDWYNHNNIDEIRNVIDGIWDEDYVIQQRR